ncbi:MAG: TIGR03067 domain-containing protein [Planctomycetes bacterium]|nr:TIGR03067 domain-containing protein [Planctomycetota bacterium]
MLDVMLTMALLGVVSADSKTSDDAMKKELKQFQGKWAAAVMIDNGKPVDEKMRKATTLIVDGNKFVLKDDDKVILEGTFKIDPLKKPKSIDATVSFGANKDVVVLGIYQIDGDVRKSCFADADKTRPDRFRKEEGFLYLEWKRIK